MMNKDDLYDSFMAGDSSMEGIWYVAVKTTGIFCRLTCTARKPKKENVEFFQSIKSALDYGYRPCKICKPLTPIGSEPRWMNGLIEEINSNPENKINDQGLRERGLDPARVRRWFKKHHGMTFQAYNRMIRINRAFGNIRQGEKIINAAFDSGYDSLSGFNETFKNIFGSSPSKSTNTNLVHIMRITTPLGPMLAGATDKGICLLEFTDRRMLETQLKRLQKLLNAQFLIGTSDYFIQLENELTAYFKGKLKEFKVPIVMDGTPFQQKTWKALLEIPYGETRSYSDQAKTVGNPAAVRAVARANGDNRIAIIIPCHRVIGSDGSLTGYGGGLWRKKYLLEFENSHK